MTSWQHDKKELSATETRWVERAQAGDRLAFEQLYRSQCSDLVVPLEQLPENLKSSMGGAWRDKQKNLKILEEQAKQD